MRSFILLELVIAFTILSLSIVPFVRYPISRLSKEIDLLFQMEVARQANNCLIHFKADLTLGKIPPQLLDSLEPKIYEQEKILVSLLPSLVRNFEKTITIKLERKKTTLESKECALINVKVAFKELRKKKFFFEEKATFFLDSSSKRS